MLTRLFDWWETLIVAPSLSAQAGFTLRIATAGAQEVIELHRNLFSGLANVCVDRNRIGDVVGLAAVLVDDLSHVCPMLLPNITPAGRQASTKPEITILEAPEP